MATPVYVLCDNNCKYEGMTKEQILTAITQAVESGTVGDCNTGFITTVKTINGRGLRFFVGTQAEYDGLSKTQKDGVFALITNDTTKDGLLEAIEELREEQNNVNNALLEITTGKFIVPKAKHADVADIAGEAWGLVTDDLYLDEENGGFYVTEAGVYLVFGIKNNNLANARKIYKTELIAIPNIESMATGATGSFAKYGSYDTGDMYNPDKFRLDIAEEGYYLARATRIMYL